MTPAELRAYYAEANKPVPMAPPQRVAGVDILRQSVAKWLPYAMQHPHAKDPVVAKLIERLRAVMRFSNQNPLALVEALDDAAPEMMVEAYAQSRQRSPALV